MAATSLDEENLENVLRQVEFYFSDSNVSRDKFLTNSIKRSEDGLVSLALICSFTRMKNLLGLGWVKPSEVLEETVVAAAEILRNNLLCSKYPKMASLASSRIRLLLGRRLAGVLSC